MLCVIVCGFDRLNVFCFVLGRIFGYAIAERVDDRTVFLQLQLLDLYFGSYGTVSPIHLDPLRCVLKFILKTTELFLRLFISCQGISLSVLRGDRSQLCASVFIEDVILLIEGSHLRKGLAIIRTIVILQLHYLKILGRIKIVLDLGMIVDIFFYIMEILEFPVIILAKIIHLTN